MNQKKNFRWYPLVLILLSLILLCSLNFCVGLLTDRFGLQLDMTDQHLFQLSDPTIDILQAMEEPVSVQVISAKEDYLPLLVEVLDQYRQAAADSLEISYLNPYTQPDLIDDYLEQGFQLKEGSILVRGRLYSRVLHLEDLFELSPSGQEIRSLKCEQQLTSAIVYASGRTSPSAVFTAGHNENATQEFQALLRQNNYTLQNVTLSMTDIPDQTSLVIIADPSVDFSPEEIRKLDAYLADQGRLMVFLDTDKLHNLSEFLSEWGIQADGIRIQEPLQFVEGDPRNIVPIYASHPINQYFSDNQIFLVMPHSTGLEQTYVSQGGIRTRKLLFSTDRAISDLESVTGPFTLAITAEKSTSKGYTRLLVIGCPEICSDRLLDNPSYSNGKFLSQAAAWCIETDQAIHIPAKDLQSAPIAVTGRQLIWIFLLLLIPPVCILLCGFRTYVRRRRS